MDLIKVYKIHIKKGLHSSILLCVCVYIYMNEVGLFVLEEQVSYMYI